MAPTSLPFATFVQRFGICKTSQAKDIRVLDVEGAGDKEGRHDLALCVSVLLVSKVCIFNVKGYRGKTDLLNDLLLIARAGSIVDGHGIKSDPNSRLFGHLNIVCRDFQFSPEERARFQSYVFDREPGLDREVQERNMARDLIKSSFESVKVFFFEPPDKHLMKMTRIPFSSIQDLGEDLPKLAVTLGDQLASVRRAKLGNRGAKPLSGPEVLGLLMHTLEEFGRKENPIIAGEGLVNAMCRSMGNAALRSFQQVLQEGIDKLKRSTSFPLGKQHLEEKITAIFKTARSAYEAKAPKDASPTLLAEFEVLVGEVESRERDELVEANRAQAQIALSKMGAECQNLIKDTFKAAFSKPGSLPISPATMEKVKASALHTAISTFDNEISVLASTQSPQSGFNICEAVNKEVAYWEKESAQKTIQKQMEDLRLADAKSKAEIDRLKEAERQTATKLRTMQSECDRAYEEMRRGAAEKQTKLRTMQSECDRAYEEMRREAAEKQAKLKEVGDKYLADAQRATDELNRLRAASSRPTTSFDMPCYFPGPSFDCGFGGGGLRFYKGGQFLPGGGRAPAGGTWL